ncbi:hypothetical protein ACOSP7_023581 [Xanthoceras sorbifolium]
MSSFHSYCSDRSAGVLGSGADRFPWLRGCLARGSLFAVTAFPDRSLVGKSGSAGTLLGGGVVLRWLSWRGSIWAVRSRGVLEVPRLCWGIAVPFCGSGQVLSCAVGLGSVAVLVRFN